jgi:A/G-specific adenine glycosylase
MKTLELTKWFTANQRDLPWRMNRDPYRIWVSEIMLQQTTTAAVRGFFTRFMTAFPNVESLAAAKLEQVYELWSGLGYYTRARNIHKAAKILAQSGFPKTYVELAELPGFGPYTSRAVSSQAFGEKVGVIDGNVIRVLSRYKAWPLEHWKTQGRNQLQAEADLWAERGDPSNVNQAFMELGATVCTPKNPACWSCPLEKTCEGRKQKKIASLPLIKPKRQPEVWIWTIELSRQQTKTKSEIALIENNYAPFLKKQWLFPGQVKKVKVRPKKFDLRHGITHHDIYIIINSNIANKKLRKSSLKDQGDYKWIPLSDVKKINPASVLQKVLAHKALAHKNSLA